MCCFAGRLPYEYSEYRDLLNNDPCEIERLHGEWLFRCAVSLVGFHTKYSEYRDLLNNDPGEIERLHGNG